ncbi:MAG: efflux RND transporter periplasmic adaptor subunit, partial [Planctomycetes bacterium]|nr:efflux RND transporter periplasmic adaptor subunit [Planctomycetota bacterium]
GVRRWKATLEEARTAYERQKKLQAKDFTSEQSVDQAREKMEVAKAELANAQERLHMLEAGPTRTEIAVQEANVKEAEAKLDLARAHLEECVIKAPFEGIITRVHVREGDLATPRSPLIEMYDPDSLVVRFSVPEAYAAEVHPGLTVEVQLDAVPEDAFRGEVVRVFPQLDASMRTRTVEAKLEESERLMPHQFARITLELGSATGAVIVPAEALRETPGGKLVAFVVKDGKAVRRMVQTGIEQEQRVQITKGIKAGERVVVTGGKLKDGDRLSVIGEGSSEF